MIKTITCKRTKIKRTYTYRGDSIVNGIKSVTIEYPVGYLKEFEESRKGNKDLPKTKQLYTNPATGKEVSYSRARAIGLIK
tara:strand:+ start:208 stop:450 length:243 start_codon:yes stop_codon:yes gene_type:complete